MRSAKGVYRGNNEIGHGYARVHISCDSNEGEFSIKIKLDDDPWNEQLLHGEFSDWKDAAVSGSKYAASVAKIHEGNWTIHRIVGLLVDTTPEFVAIAAGRAIWNATNYDLNADDDSNLTIYAKREFPDSFH